MTIVIDSEGAQIQVGDLVRVEYDAIRTGTITEITEPDADYDDDAGRAVMYPPTVTVQFGDAEDKFRGYADFAECRSPEEYDDPPFRVDDVTKVAA